MLERASFPSPWKTEFFASELNAAGRFNLVVVTTDGRLVGYLFTMYFLDELHVNKIAIDTERRRSGLARELMRRCFGFADENDLRMISLEVRESNVAARSLYREFGFVESYMRPDYYPEGESAVVMELVRGGGRG